MASSDEARTVQLVDGNLDALSLVERVCSVLSLLGCLFIIVTFCSSKAFHKPINRLVFYASFGNGITNIGTLIARTYVGSPHSVGCQLQAFLIQMFMPADAFWTLAMAVNVYLTFYYKFDAQRLRKMEIPYMACCYGIPLIPALTYVFVKDGDGNRVYGDAKLWCWVTMEWEIWRILTFYGPIWIVILVTFFIYIRTGGDIYKKRKQLREFSSQDPEGLANFNELFAPMKTTEVSVITERISTTQDETSPQHLSQRQPNSSPVVPDGIDAVYSVSITASQAQARTLGSKPSVSQTGAPVPASSRGRNYEANNAAWSYAKCALLFFTALLITWIPSSANRVYSVIHGSQSSAALEFMSAFVLPLQGFWNAIIYMVTSWKACKLFWFDIRHSRLFGRRGGTGFLQRGDTFQRTNRDRARGPKNCETESTTELAESGRARSTSRD